MDSESAIQASFFFIAARGSFSSRVHECQHYRGSGVASDCLCVDIAILSFETVGYIMDIIESYH